MNYLKLSKKEYDIRIWDCFSNETVLTTLDDWFF